MRLQGTGTAWFLIAVHTGSSLWGVLPGLLHGLGKGLTFPTFYAGTTRGVWEAQQEVTSALVTVSVQLGSALGVAVLAAVLDQLTRRRVAFQTAIIVAVAFPGAGVVCALVGLRASLAVHSHTSPS